MVESKIQKFIQRFKPARSFKELIRTVNDNSKKYELLNELEELKKSEISKELQLICVGLVKFQWIEYQSKLLLWSLYGATRKERASISITYAKKDQIDKMLIRDVARELDCFYFSNTNNRNNLKDVSKKLTELSTFRNQVNHHLFSKKLKDRRFKTDLNLFLKRMNNLEENINDILIPVLKVLHDTETKVKYVSKRKK